VRAAPPRRTSPRIGRRPRRWLRTTADRGSPQAPGARSCSLPGPAPPCGAPPAARPRLAPSARSAPSGQHDRSGRNARQRPGSSPAGAAQSSAGARLSSARYEDWGRPERHVGHLLTALRGVPEVAGGHLGASGQEDRIGDPGHPPVRVDGGLPQHRRYACPAVEGRRRRQETRTGNRPVGHLIDPRGGVSGCSGQHNSQPARRSDMSHEHHDRSRHRSPRGSPLRE
jgi:hypothetical protein